MGFCRSRDEQPIDLNDELSFNFIGDAQRDYLDPRSCIEAGL
jgi:hypothetical protein